MQIDLTIEELKSRGFVNPTRAIHTLCGAIVFWTDGAPRVKAGILNPENVILSNGVKPKAGDPIICQGCGFDVRKNQLQWLLNDD